MLWINWLTPWFRPFGAKALALAAGQYLDTTKLPFFIDDKNLISGCVRTADIAPVVIALTARDHTIQLRKHEGRMPVRQPYHSPR